MGNLIPEQTNDLEYIIDPQEFKIDYLSYTEEFLRNKLKNFFESFLTNTSWGSDENFKVYNMYSKKEKSTHGLIIKNINTTGESIGFDDYIGQHKSRFSILNDSDYLSTNNITSIVDISYIKLIKENIIYDGSVDVKLSMFPPINYKSEIEKDMSKIKIEYNSLIFNPISINIENQTIRIPNELISLLNDQDQFTIKYIHGNVPTNGNVFKITIKKPEDIENYLDNEFELNLETLKIDKTPVVLYPIELYIVNTIDNSANLNVYVNGELKQRSNDWKYDKAENKITILKKYGNASEIEIKNDNTILSFKYSNTKYHKIIPDEDIITVDGSNFTKINIFKNGLYYTDYNKIYNDYNINNVLNQEIIYYTNEKSINEYEKITYGEIKNNITFQYEKNIIDAYIFTKKDFNKLMFENNLVYLDDIHIIKDSVLQLKYITYNEKFVTKVIPNEIKDNLIPGVVLNFMNYFYINEPQYVLYNMYPQIAGKIFGYNANLSVDIEVRLRDMPAIIKFNESFMPFLKIKLRRLLEQYGMIPDMNISDGGISSEEINGNLNIEKIFIKTYSFNLISQMYYVDYRRKVPFIITKLLLTY